MKVNTVLPLIAVQHRVRIPEAIRSEQPGVQVGGRSLPPYGQPEPPEGGGILRIGRVVEGNLHVVAQLWRIPFQRLPGQEGKQDFLLLFVNTSGLSVQVRASCWMGTVSISWFSESSA